MSGGSRHKNGFQDFSRAVIVLVITYEDVFEGNA